MKDTAMAPNPGLAISHVFQTASTNVSLQVTCDRAAVMLYLDAWPMQGHFSDNLFVCLPGYPVHVVFVGSQEFSMYDFNEALVVTSLGDTLEVLE